MSRSIVFDATRFNDLPAEVALRLLGRAVAHVGSEGPVELGKLELLYEALRQARAPLRRTLAGALVAVGGGRLVVERAPPRRRQPRAGPATADLRNRSRINSLPDGPVPLAGEGVTPTFATVRTRWCLDLQAVSS